ncbi:molecular chaperone DnaJ [Aestuariivirga sp.]|uniref:molecular chaperone DnaJ n=1 Tax=Aestuariivirga sp. TaxID=2650926 RepID=UPI00391BB09A
MANLLIGLAIVVGGWWLIKAFANAQPAQVRGLVRKIGGGLIIAFSGLLALRGQINLAMPLFVLGLGLMGQQMVFPNGMPWQRKTPGQSSKVATGLLAMELDHDSGRMDGEVLAGPFKGRRLSSLSLEEAQRLHAQCAASADQSRALLEAWIERSHPEWRAKWGGNGQSAPRGASTKMTKAEALAILGLKDGATADEVRSAHRRLMKAAHPDLGGSDYLAAKINEAKELLLHDGP